MQYDPNARLFAVYEIDWLQLRITAKVRMDFHVPYRLSHHYNSPSECSGQLGRGEMRELGPHVTEVASKTEDCSNH